MPCSGGKRWEDEEAASIAVPVLCNLVRVFGIDVVIQALDRECGVDPDRVVQWWRRHRAQDFKRRESDRFQGLLQFPLHLTIDHRPRAEREA